MKWASLIALVCAIGINYEQAEARGTIEVYFVFDSKALRKFLTWGQARSISQAKAMAMDELDYMLTELNIHYESLSGLGLKMGRRDVKFLDRDLFTPYGMIQPADALKQFKNYLNKENAQATLKYDMVVLFTGYDLGSGGSNSTAGYADLGTVCKEGHAAGVVEFGGTYGSISITAHETGHIMGSNHDGSGDGHIMSPATVDKSPYRWSFSSFSRGQISNKIQELDQAGNNCLKETNRATVIPNVGVPDALSTPDKICLRRYGPDSFMCRFRETIGDAACFSFLCDTKDPGGMCWSAVTSDGMACGKGKACRKGKCIRDPKISQDIDDKCPFGDMKKIFIKDDRRYMECGELIKSGKGLCSSGMTKARCCKTCGDLDSGDANCPYGDSPKINFNRRMQTCEAVLSQGFGCNSDFMKTQCCKSCGNKKKNDGDCTDNNKNCPSWAARQECAANPNYMLKNCKKSCKKCGGGNNNNNHNNNDGDCKDNNENCPDWAARRQCTANPNYMLKNCKKSCKKCGRGKRQTECKDTTNDCPIFKTRGYCKTLHGWMNKYCPKSCNQC